MLYFAIFNPETHELDAEKSFTDTTQAEIEWPLWPLECLNRGGAWQAYRGDVPFTWPAEEPAA